MDKTETLGYQTRSSNMNLMFLYLNIIEKVYSKKTVLIFIKFYLQRARGNVISKISEVNFLRHDKIRVHQFSGLEYL